MNLTRLWPALTQVGPGAEERGNRRQVDAFTEVAQALVALSAAGAQGAPVTAKQEVLGMMSLWKDAGNTTRKHVMGDASAASGIFRRVGSGSEFKRRKRNVNCSTANSFR